MAEDSRALPPPQFRLRSLLLGMTFFSVLCAVMVAAGLLWTTAIILLASLIVLHVAGNAIGIRLRDGKLQEPVVAIAPRRLSIEEMEQLAAAPQRLRENTSLRRPWLFFGMLSASVSGTLGGIVIAILVGKKLTIPGRALGIFSAAVVGGLFGFMASSLYCVAKTAWREALAASNDPQQPIFETKRTSEGNQA
jgi:hypothetical protein